jgi:hypothetical protein
LASVVSGAGKWNQALVATANVAVRVAQAYAYDAISASIAHALAGRAPNAQWRDRIATELSKILGQLAFLGRPDVAFALDVFGVLDVLADGGFNVGSTLDLVVPPSVCPWPATPSQVRAAYAAIVWAARAVRQAPNHAMGCLLHWASAGFDRIQTGLAHGRWDLAKLPPRRVLHTVSRPLLSALAKQQ